MSKEFQYTKYTQSVKRPHPPEAVGDVALRFFGVKNEYNTRILTKSHSFLKLFTPGVDSAKNNAEFLILDKDSH